MAAMPVPPMIYVLLTDETLDSDADWASWITQQRGRQQLKRENHLRRLIACLLSCIVSTTAAMSSAQSSNNPAPLLSALPPSTQTEEVRQTLLPDAPSTAEEESANISGSVLDPSGAAISGAEITVTRVGGSKGRTVVTGVDGRFALNSFVPGSYVIFVKAAGFQPVTFPKFTLAANQTYDVQTLKLSIAAATTDIVVQPTEVIASEQIKAEEKQRLFAIVPDFYTSYVWDAAPLNTKQKFSLAARDTLDFTTFIGVSVGAGIQQARNSYPGFGQGAEGYAKRWGALFATGRTSDFLSRAAFPSLFHQDPRYFYQGSGTKWSRAKHAVAYAFVARSDSGHLMPNYSYFLADVSSGALSNVYYPASSRGAGLVFTTAAEGLGGRAAQNLVREFLFKRLTKHVPSNGKPAATGGNP
jgi:hypothetical protein